MQGVLNSYCPGSNNLILAIILYELSESSVNFALLTCACAFRRRLDPAILRDRLTPRCLRPRNYYYGITSRQRRNVDHVILQGPCRNITGSMSQYYRVKRVTSRSDFCYVWHAIRARFQSIYRILCSP